MEIVPLLAQLPAKIAEFLALAASLLSGYG
jgi:hypothetical protein